MLPPGLGKPPPLLPTPSGPPQPQPASLTGGPMGDHASPSPVPLLPSPGLGFPSLCLFKSVKPLML